MRRSVDQTLSPTSLAAVVASVRRLRVANMDREFDLQGVLAQQLGSDGIPYEREFRLGPGNVIDFYIPGAGVGIEVKKGKPHSTARVLAQVERYAAFACVKAIVVAVEGKVHANATTRNGKPVVIMNLAKQWGVTL